MNYKKKWMIFVVLLCLADAAVIILTLFLADQRAMFAVLGPPLMVSLYLMYALHAAAFPAIIALYVAVFFAYNSLILIPLFYYLKQSSRKFLLLVQAGVILIHILLGCIGVSRFQEAIGT